MIILGIESSCDDTGIALLSTQEGLLSHSLSSQSLTHDPYGGVVPELASRGHIQHISLLVKETIRKAKINTTSINAIGYTAGPGLNGALLVGAAFANGWAYANNIPAIPVHHLEAHFLSAFLSTPKPTYPFISLLVSGGHTLLVHVKEFGQYHIIGETLDDAAGETFDKTAQLLGLGYPGGPEIEKYASQDPSFFHEFPRPLKYSQDLNFSFSGLKTAVRVFLEKNPSALIKNKAGIAFQIQEAIVDVLVEKSLLALEKTNCKQLVIAGGVSANKRLRTVFQTRAPSQVQLYWPDFIFCTDNGAMIANCAAEHLRNKGEPILEEHKSTGFFSVYPRWKLPQIEPSPTC